jgi:hypothetical protein
MTIWQSMVNKLITYGILFWGSLFLEREYGLIERFMPWALFFPPFWFLTYVSLLYLEIKSKIPKEPSQKKIRWTGYWFTFGVGVMFWVWVYIGLKHSDFLPTHEDYLFLLINWIIGGAVFGIVGMAITAIIMHWVLKLPDKT